MSRLVLSSYRKAPGDQFEDNMAFIGTAKSQFVWVFEEYEIKISVAAPLESLCRPLLNRI